MFKIVGDINYSDGFFDTGIGIGSQIKNGSNPFEHIKRSNKDIWLGNCECVISDFSNKIGPYKNQFRIEPSALNNIKHIEIYNVANNHSMQHGEKAFHEMLQFFEQSGLSYVGGENQRTIEINHQEKKIGLMAFSQREEKYSKSPLYWYNPEYLDIELEYRSIAHLDFKIAYVHWGNEFIDRPYVDQKKFAHWLVDVGFDLIVGLHPHVLQGYEIYKGKYIYYSIGNFVFNMPLESTRYSIILNVDVSSDTLEIEHNYIQIGNNNFPKIIPKKDVPFKYRFEYLNKKLFIEDENELYYALALSFNKKYRYSNYTALAKSIFRLNPKVLIHIFLDYVKRNLS